MTKGSEMELHARTQLPIAQLEPSINSSASLITGVITLVWPYSSSTNSTSVLLAEPDFRLRRNKGQVRITFRGSSAKAVARSGLNSGDGLVLGLEGVEWIEDEGATKPPGRGVDWELRFGERVILQFEQESKQPVLLDIDHPEASPEPQALSHTPPISPLYNGVTHSPRSHKALEPQVWSSPVFLKRKYHALEPFLNPAYDPFADEDGYVEGLQRKRTKFGRGSGQWRFTDRTPSPEKEFGVRTPDTTDYSMSAPAQKAHALERREDFAIPSKVSSFDVKNNIPSPTINADGPLSPSVTAESHRGERSTSGRQVEEQDTIAGTNRKLHTNAAFTEDLSNGGHHVIGQIEQTPLQTIEALEYGNIDVGAGAFTPHAGTSLYINTTIATSDLSATDKTERFETPDPPRLRALLSPGLPLVSPLINRKDKGTIPFDADDERDLLAATGNSSAMVNSSAGSSTRNETPPISSDEEVGRSTKSIEAAIEVDLGNSVQPGTENVRSQQQVPVPEALSTSQEDGISLLEKVLPKTREEQIIERNIEGPQMGDPSHISDNDHDSQIDGGLNDPGVSPQQSLTNNVPDVAEHWMRVKAAEEQPGYSSVPNMEPASETEINSLFDGDTSAGEDLEMPDEAPGVQPVSADASLDDLFNGSSIDVGSSRFNSDNEGQGDPKASVIRHDNRDIDTISDSSSEDTEEESEENSDGEEEQELEDIDSDSAISSEDADLDRLDVVYPPQVLEIIALDSDEEDIGDLSEAHKLDDPTINFIQPSDMSTHTAREVNPPVEAETKSSVIVSPTMQIVEVVSEYSSVPEEVDLIPILEEESAGSESNIHAPYEQAPSLLQDGEQNVNDATTGTFSPIEGPLVGQTQLLEDAQDRQHSFLDPRLQNQLATPDATQQAESFSLASQESLHSVQQDRTLPTPQQSQIPLKDLPTARIPISPEKLSLIEKLKELRTSSAGRTGSVNELTTTIINPYFNTGQPESGANSSDESDVDSVNHEDQAGEHRIETSSLEPLEKTADEEQYTAQKEAISTSNIPASTGFRTPLAYFASLSSLSHHFNTITSILAISISSSTPFRAKSGPRDFYQAICLADPSSNIPNSTSNFTTAQIFRPYKDALPILRTGNSILLRNFKVQTQEGRLLLLSTDSSAWAVFSQGEEPQIRGPPVELGPEERGFAKGLGEWWESLGEEVKGPLLARAEEARTKTEAKMRKQAKGKGKGKAAPRKSFVDGMHELRDGTRWTDESEESRTGLHELRDGTVWRDTEE